MEIEHDILHVDARRPFPYALPSKSGEYRRSRDDVHFANRVHVRRFQDSVAFRYEGVQLRGKGGAFINRNDLVATLFHESQFPSVNMKGSAQTVMMVRS